MEKFFKFIYKNYIKEKEDLDILKDYARKIIYPAWVVRAFYIYMISFFLFPLVLIHMWWDRHCIADKFLTEIEKKKAF